MQILRASEDYLETMLMMKEKHGYIRSIDIAEYLGVTKPSVSYATKRLRENGYIDMDEEGFITLNPSGKAIAERIYRFDEVTAVYLMSGGYDLAVTIKGTNLRDVAMFVTDRLAPLGGVLSTTTHFILHRYKEKDKMFLKNTDERSLVSP